MTREWIIGIDPGCNETGIICRRQNDLKGGWLVVRKDVPEPIYILECLDSIHALILRWGSKPESQMLVAIEDIEPPNPHLGQIELSGIIGTAKVFGAVLGAFPQAVVVDPAGLGSLPFAAYPVPLRPTRGQGKGHDENRHLRSAWDIAGVARMT